MDLQQLRTQQWEPRTKSVPAPGLATDDDPNPVWVVRAPNSNEIACSNEAQANRQRFDSVVLAMERGTKSEAVAELREKFGLSDDVRPDIARRIELLVRCSVDPACSEEDAVWMGNNHPVLFYELTNTILELAGQGAEVKKTPNDSTPATG